ncbi:hypothetical protein [Ancylobacter amanitiformis]|uniref:Uncharacterized protein n=1 Tax=Ancylobacter amanitiformis TaxID=217069 RepID=A0ABU0LQD7_9HYPH|nr:hypothetical protein [Ancylobacter amanitiformis]MDQ0510910.1 hypothetical protein [Ancylobacter amanitiformis]
MNFTSATVTLKSMSPYSQSYDHGLPMLKGEDKGDYDRRNFMSKAHFNAAGHLVIPAVAIHQALVAAAKYSKRQIPGQGKATWTAKFKSGLILAEDIDTGIPRSEVGFIDVKCDSKGMTGAQKSTTVTRRFPQVPSWSARFDIWIVDPIITEEVFREMVDIAGLFVGIGRWRPEMSGGMNGRFSLAGLEWHDNREFVAKAA